MTFGELKRDLIRYVVEYGERWNAHPDVSYQFAPRTGAFVHRLEWNGYVVSIVAPNNMAGYYNARLSLKAGSPPREIPLLVDDPVNWDVVAEDFAGLFKSMEDLDRTVTDRRDEEHARAIDAYLPVRLHRGGDNDAV